MKISEIFICLCMVRFLRYQPSICTMIASRLL